MKLNSIIYLLLIIVIVSIYSCDNNSNDNSDNKSDSTIDTTFANLYDKNQVSIVNSEEYKNLSEDQKAMAELADTVIPEYQITEEQLLGKWAISEMVVNYEPLPVDMLFEEYILEFTVPKKLITIQNGIKTKIKYKIKKNSLINVDSTKQVIIIKNVDEQKLIITRIDESGKSEEIFKKIE